MQHWYKRGLLLFALLAIFALHWYIPFLQKKWDGLQVSKLNGSYEDTQKPNFWTYTWLNGDYQKAYDAYLRDRSDIAPLMVRLKSQVDYSLFNKISHQNIMPGINNYLFAKTDCDAYIGKNYKGYEWISEKVRKLKAIIDHYESKGKHFVVLTPPSKASVFPEHLPAFYRNYPVDSTNRTTFNALFEANDIPFIDFEYLKAEAHRRPYPVYPQAGLHWSNYGLSMAADSLRNYIGEKLNIQMIEMNWEDSIVMKTQLENSDNELMTAANFLMVPELSDLAYPQIKYISDSTTVSPKILSVGDSFYLLIYKYGIHKALFAKGSMFWYYHHELYPARMKNGKRVYAGGLDPLEHIEANDMIIITVYEQNLERFAFNFVDKTYDLLFPN